ncbi:MAG: hypothetical protein ACMUEL_04870 [Flavobacteriales bacterium Tduv]
MIVDANITETLCSQAIYYLRSGRAEKKWEKSNQSKKRKGKKKRDHCVNSKLGLFSLL